MKKPIKRKMHLAVDLDSSEAYCGLRLVHDAYLTRDSQRVSCATCRERYYIEGRPTPVQEISPRQAIDALNSELDAYLVGTGIRKPR